MKSFLPSDVALFVVAGVVTLALMAPAVAQNRSLPPPPVVFPPPFPPPPPPASSMIIPRPPPEIVAPPVMAVPEGEARQTERVCIEKEMCVDVPVSSKAPQSSGEPK